MKIKPRHLAYAGLGLVALFGIANARSRQKCRNRKAGIMASFRKQYGKDLTEPEIRAMVKSLDGDWPVCDGVPLFREGV